MEKVYKLANSHKGSKDWSIYELCKAKLKQLILKPVEYDLAIKNICRILGL